MYYAYKDKYNKEINSLDTKNREKLHYKKLRLSDYSFEEKQDEKQDEKQEEIPEKPITEANKFIEWTDKKGKDIKSEVFSKYFSTERPSQIFKYIYEADNRDKKIW